jgi:hypothetical protein
MSERKVDLTVQQWNIQLDAAWQGGQSYEREAIVAWLRSEACFTWLRRNTDGFTVGQADDLSVAISDGEHLRGDDE